MTEGAFPGIDVQLVGVHQRSIQIKDDSLNHGAGLKLKCEKNRADDEGVGDTLIPSDGRAEEHKRHAAKNDERDAFLQNL